MFRIWPITGTCTSVYTQLLATFGAFCSLVPIKALLLVLLIFGRQEREKKHQGRACMSLFFPASYIVILFIRGVAKEEVVEEEGLGTRLHSFLCNMVLTPRIGIP